MNAASGTGRVRRGWEYYRRYTKRRTGVHAAATAALTGFGLLAYFEQWFVAVAIVAYLLPPVYLYLTGDDLTDPEDAPGSTGDDRNTPTVESADDETGRSSGTTIVDGDADADGLDEGHHTNDSDTDSDADTGDTDTDTDSDNDDGDTDTDDGDSDSDADDGDTDNDSDSDG